MANQDVTPQRPRFPRTSALWLTLGIAVLIVVILIVASVLGSRGGSGPSGAAASPSVASSASPGAATPDSSPIAPVPSDEPIVQPGPGVPAPTAPAVRLDDEATAAPGVTVDIRSIEPMEGEAVRAGDVAGPAVRFVLRVTNKTDRPVSLATALVNVYYGTEAIPASELSEPGGKPLPQDVAAGRSAAGTFIFTIPEDERESVLITLDYQIGSPVVAFEGSVP